MATRLPFGARAVVLLSRSMLRIDVDEFWSYGFQLPDGFLF